MDKRVAHAKTNNKKGRQAEIVFRSLCGAKLLKADCLAITEGLYLKDLQ